MTVAGRRERVLGWCWVVFAVAQTAWAILVLNQVFMAQPDDAGDWFLVVRQCMQLVWAGIAWFVAYCLLRTPGRVTKIRIAAAIEFLAFPLGTILSFATLVLVQDAPDPRTPIPDASGDVSLRALSWWWWGWTALALLNVGLAATIFRRDLAGVAVYAGVACAILVLSPLYVGFALRRRRISASTHVAIALTALWFPLGTALSAYTWNPLMELAGEAAGPAEGPTTPA